MIWSTCKCGNEVEGKMSELDICPIKECRRQGQWTHEEPREPNLGDLEDITNKLFALGETLRDMLNKNRPLGAMHEGVPEAVEILEEEDKNEVV